MKRNTQKVVIEAEVPRSLTEAGVDVVDAAIKAATPYLEHARDFGSHRVEDAQHFVEDAQHFVEDAQHRLAPLAEQARERIAPLAEQARERIAPLAEQARERAGHAQDVLAPYVSDAQTRLSDAQTRLTDAQARIAPVAHEAKIRSAVGARGTLDNLAPRLEHALLAVGPLAEEAAHRLHDDFVPRASLLLDKAAEIEPMSRRQRRKAAKAAQAYTKGLARQERSGGNAWKVLLILTGLIGLGVLVAKKLATPKQDAWQNYQPTPPAPARPQPAAAEAAPVTEPEEGNELPADIAAAEVSMIGEGGAVTEADNTLSTDTSTSYGEGSFVGTKPPAEYPIKGNPRSMKYHVPGSDSFDRTISDVWFTTEEAAQAAGFTKATR